MLLQAQCMVSSPVSASEQSGSSVAALCRGFTVPQLDAFGLHPWGKQSKGCLTELNRTGCSTWISIPGGSQFGSGMKGREGNSDNMTHF